MRSPNRTHEKKSFFKYMSLETAMIVLENNTLRWSSPLIFNDPFDVPRELLPDVTEKNIGEAVAKMLIAELVNPRENRDNLNIRVRIMLDVYKNLFPYGIPREVFTELSKIITDPPLGEKAPAALQDLKDIWLTMLNNRRILCLCESPIIPPMWNHYASGYKGIVLEFECLDIIDSAWLIAKPINYTNTPPLTYSANGMAKLLFMTEDLAAKYLNEEITFIKKEDWAYEKEWRISTHKRPFHNGNFSDIQFSPLELKSIILGPYFDEDKSEGIFRLAHKYPRAQLCKASLSQHGNIEIKKYGMN